MKFYRYSSPSVHSYLSVNLYEYFLSGFGGSIVESEIASSSVPEEIWIGTLKLISNVGFGLRSKFSFSIFRF